MPQRRTVRRPYQALRGLIKPSEPYQALRALGKPSGVLGNPSGAYVTSAVLYNLLVVEEHVSFTVSNILLRHPGKWLWLIIQRIMQLKATIFLNPFKLLQPERGVTNAYSWFWLINSAAHQIYDKFITSYSYLVR